MSWCYLWLFHLKSPLSFVLASAIENPLLKMTQPTSGHATADLSAAPMSHEAETLCFISPRHFRLLWWLIIVIYSLVALQLILLGGFYFFIMGIPSVAYYMDMFHLIPVSQFPLVVAVYALVAVLIMAEIFRILRISVRSKRLSLLDEAALNAATARTAKMAAAIRKSSTLGARVRRLYLGYFRFISVRGPYFELVMLTRELIEISVQVSQAYQSSRFTPNVYLNFAYGVLIVVNCLSSPLLERMNHDGVGRFRMNVLIVDLFLDFVWLLLPLALFPRYIMGFFGSNAVMYEDTFMVRAFMETQLMFATSQVDLFTKVLPSLSIYFTIRKIRVLVRRRDTTSNAKLAAVKVLSAPLKPAGADSAVKPTENNPKGSSRPPAQLTYMPTRRAHHMSYLPRHWRYVHAAQLVIEAVLIGLGFFTLVMYVLVAVFRGSCESGCKLILYPWFEYAHCRCSVQEISCHVRSITGTGDEMRRAFGAMEPVGLQSLIISHCPQLEIPQEIRGFNDLYGFEIYNSSISSWPADASLSAEYFTRLSFVYLLRTYLTKLPDGLLQGDLPSTLMEIDVIVSNLTTLPDDLYDKWHGVRTLYLDHGQFTVPPPVLGKMKLESLSLYNNSIRVIPNTTFATSSLSYLILNANPLRQLPSSLGSVNELYELQLQLTNISEISPDWFTDQTLSTAFKVFARGSPLCAGHDAPDDAQAVSAPLALASAFDVESGGVRVSCAVRGSVYNGKRSTAYFALEGKTLDRQIQ